MRQVPAWLPVETPARRDSEFHQPVHQLVVRKPLFPPFLVLFLIRGVLFFLLTDKVLFHVELTTRTVVA